MAKDYIPKSSGESFLKRAVSLHYSRKRKVEERGKVFSAEMVSIPIEQAEEIVNKHKIRMPSVYTLAEILEELEIQVNAGYESYSPTSLRTLVSRAIFHLNKIK